VRVRFFEGVLLVTGVHFFGLMNVKQGNVIGGASKSSDFIFRDFYRKMPIQNLRIAFVTKRVLITLLFGMTLTSRDFFITT
jgi:hypothetical protein